MQYVLGVDIGGKTVKIGLVSYEGEILDKFEIKTNVENNGESILSDIRNAIYSYLEEKSICKNETVKPLLHKLRKYRNKCVHSNKEFDYEEPTYVEFEYLVNYVTNFGYGDDEYE